MQIKELKPTHQSIEKFDDVAVITLEQALTVLAVSCFWLPLNRMKLHDSILFYIFPFSEHYSSLFTTVMKSLLMFYTMFPMYQLVSRSVHRVILDAKVGPPSFEDGLAEDILSMVGNWFSICQSLYGFTSSYHPSLH